MIVTLPPSPGKDSQTKNNRKSQALSALLSATALGVFLEGCGGGGGGGSDSGGGSSGSGTTAPISVQVTGTTPHFATASAEAFVGDEHENTVSYKNADAGVVVHLQASANNQGSLAHRDTYQNIEHIEGSPHDDTLIGDSQNNNLDGGNGADTLHGGIGADTLHGGAGADTLHGGEGADTLHGGEGDHDTANYALANEAVRVDLSRTGAQIDFDGLEANNHEAIGDTLISIEHIVGSAHDDTLTGDSQNNNLQGGAGADTLTGGIGADTLHGGEGDHDTANYALANEAVRVDLSRTNAQINFDGLEANNHEAIGDTLISIEHIVGSAHGDTLTGDRQNNNLQGGKGADTLTGGDGDDTASYRLANEAVRVDLSRTGAQIDFDGAEANNHEAVGDTLSGIENIVGSPHDDTLIGDRQNNNLQGGAGADNYIFISGDGTDTINDDDGGKILFLQGTNNDYTGAIYTFSRLDERADEVTLTITKNGNTLNVLNFDRDPSSVFNFCTRTSSGIETTIPAASLVVPLRLGSEQRPFSATDAPDTFTGVTNNDWVSYEGAIKTVGYNIGVSVELGENDNPAIVSETWAQGDTLIGIDNIIGSDHSDSLKGNSGDNILRGGRSEDRLEGGKGADTLDGGEGHDVVSYEFASEGVRGDLSRTSAQIDFDGVDANNNEAVGDTLISIENIIGSNFNDWLTGDEGENFLQGGAGNDRLQGGEGDDFYVFRAGDGTDTLVDDGGEILFNNNNNNDYTGAVYTFTRENPQNYEAVTLTIRDAADNTLNVINFASDPTDNFNFYLIENNDINPIPAASLLVPPRPGSESTPFLATLAADRFQRATDNEGGIYDWVSYEESTDTAGNAAGVSVALGAGTTPATLSQAWAEGDTLIAINNLIGSQADDFLVGNSNDNTLRGGAGADTLTGGEGADTLTGGEGDDTASYEFATQGVRVNLYETPVQIGFETNTYGFLANNNDAVGDIISEIKHIIGSAFDDWLTGDDETNYLQGGAGNDRLEAGGEEGEEGDGRFNGGTGADTLIGGDYDDTALYTDSDKGVRIDLSRTEAQQDFDETHGFAKNNNEAVGDILFSIEVVEGSDHDDWLIGEGGNSILLGGKGDDRLEGGSAVDTFLFNAGDGTDTIIDDPRSSRPNSALGTIVFLHGADNNAYDENTIYTLTRPEATGKAVTLTVTNNGITLNILKFANDPTDHTFGFNFRTLEGTNTFDRGNRYTSKIFADDFVGPPLGSETYPFLATLEPDRFQGATDYDWVSYINSEGGVRISLADNAAAATVSQAWAERDTLTAINNLVGSDHNDVLRGNSGDNTLNGGDGIDVLFGGAGADTLNGGGGIDRLEGGAGADTLDGGAGFNYATYINSDKGVRVDLSLTGAQQDFGINSFGFTANNNDAVGDTFISIKNIRGSTFDDWLTGNNGRNELDGRQGNDRIAGGAGDDYLNGGEGADTLDGQQDTDTAGYNSATKAVRVNLLLQGQQQQDFEANSFGFTANSNEAVGDTLSNIENIAGSDYNDWLTGDDTINRLFGDRGNDRMEGGKGFDIYAFRINDGTDTIADNGGSIVFEQGANNDYAGADYTFTRNEQGRGDAVTLTVSDSAGNKINVLEFASDPTADYIFSTRIGIVNTEIAATSLVVPEKLPGSESKPFLATDTTNSFQGSTGTDNYWVSYAESVDTAGIAAGVSVELGDNDNPAIVSKAWATGDTLIRIDNLIGSDGDDILTGNSDDNILRGLAGSDTYIFDAGDGNDILRATDDGIGNNLLFRPSSGETHGDTDFLFNRGFLDENKALSVASDGSDLEIVVSRVGVETNRVIIQQYYSTGDDNAYTIYRNALAVDMIVSTQPAETS